MKRLVRKLFKSCDGATAIEYGLIGFFISLGAILALGLFGDAVNDIYFSLSETVDGPVERVSNKSN